MKNCYLSLFVFILVLGCADKTVAQKWTDNSGRDVPVTIIQNKDTTVYDFGTIVLSIDSLDGSISAIDNDDSAPRLVLPLGHHGKIGHAHFSSDGKYVVTSCYDKTARIWDVITGRELLVISGLDNYDVDAFFSADGKTILVKDHYSTATIYDVATGNTIQSFQLFPEGGSIVALSPDGKLIATVNVGYDTWRYENNTFSIWNVIDGSELHVVSGLSGNVSSLAFSADGKWLLTTSTDSITRIWDVTTGVEIRVFEGHNGPVNKVFLSYTKQLAITSSNDGNALIWDISSGKQLQVLLGHTRALKCVDFSPKEEYVLTTSSDSTARVWNVATGKEHLLITGISDQQHNAQFSADGSMVIIANDNSIRFWDIATRKELKEMALVFNNELNVCSISKEMKYILVSASDGTATIRELASGKEWPLYTGLVDESYTVCVSPSGELVFSANDDIKARMWDISTGRDVQTFSGYPIPVVTAAFSPDGKKVITGGAIRFASSSEKEKIDGTARVWDASNGKQVLALKGDPSNLYSAEFISDGKNILTTNEDGSAVLWDASTGERIRALSVNDGDASAAILSTLRQFVLFMTNNSVVQVYDIFSGKKTCELLGHEGYVRTAIMSSDQLWIVSTSMDGTARVWNAKSGEQVHVLFKQDSYVSSAVFSPDGKRIASINDDGTIRIWDVISGLELQRFYGSWGIGITSAVFSPDGEFVVSCHDDNSCRVYNLSTGDLHLMVQNSGTFLDISFSPDGKYLITSGFDGMTVVSDLSKGKILYRRIQLKGGEWLVIDDQGRFDGTAKGLDLLYFVQGMEVVLDDELFNRLYVPQLVEKIFR